jgi:hypothetical protein
MKIDFSAIWKSMKESRTLWAAVVGLVIIVGRTAWPEFPLSDAVIEPAILLLVSYFMAEGLEGFRPAPKVMETLFASRKFLMSVAGLVVLIVNNVNPEFPLEHEQVLWIIKLIAGGNIAMGAEGLAKK